MFGMGRYLLFFLVNILVMIVGTTVISFALKYFGYGHLLNQSTYQGLLFVCFMWGMLGSFVSLMLSKWMAKRGTHMVDDDPQFRPLVAKVHLLSKRAGLEKMPEVGIFESADINAFATGPSRNNSMVAVSTGLLQKLDDEQTDAVLAHEVAHIANGDMVTMALVQGVVNAFVMFFARLATIAVENLMRGDDKEGGGLGFFAYMIVYNLFYTLFAFASYPVIAGFSRWREYRADAGAGKLVGNGAMISALQALQKDYEVLTQGDKSIATEGGLKAMRISAPAGMMEWFATHPSLDKRIAALR